MTIKLSKEEINLILIGMTSSGVYPLNMQKKAFELVMKLRDALREET